MAKVLENCKDDLGRENILKQATSLNGLAQPMPFPGSKSIPTRPTSPRSGKSRWRGLTESHRCCSAMC
jgi:hypothetical protein